jgi:outer membrane protein assembly factor BamB
MWQQDLGLLDGGWTADSEAHWGFGSSPIIYKSLVIVQCDTQKRSFIAAYDVNDGKKVWETPRDEDSSWSTPAIYESKDHVELVTSGTKYYRGYNPMTGKVKIPTPIIANGLYYLSGGDAHAKRNFYALHTGLKGDVKAADSGTANEFVAWQSPVIKPHIVTPIVYGDYLYVCTDNGVLTQYQAKTGEPGYRARLGSGGAFSASPVAADGRLYFANEDGEVFVIKAGSEYQLLSQNPMGEVVIASPAITKGMLVVRGQNHVFAIAEKK